MAGYIVDQYCLRFDREVVCIVVDGYIVNQYCLRLDREVVCIVLAGYAVDRSCFRGVIAVFILMWLAILLTITV